MEPIERLTAAAAAREGWHTDGTQLAQRWVTLTGEPWGDGPWSLLAASVCWMPVQGVYHVLVTRWWSEDGFEQRRHSGEYAGPEDTADVALAVADSQLEALAEPHTEAVPA